MRIIDDHIRHMAVAEVGHQQKERDRARNRERDET